MICVFGTICVDRVHRVDDTPHIGGYSEVLETEEFLGGEAANSALALLRWGNDVKLVSNPVCDDRLGNWITKEVEEAGIAWEFGSSTDLQTPYCDIYVGSSNSDRILFGTGFVEVDSRWNSPTVDLESPDWFTCDANFPLNARKALSAATRSGAKTYAMDCVSQEFVGGTDPDFLQTSIAWSGLSDEAALNDQLQFVSQLVDKFDSKIVVTLGSQGLIYASRHFDPIVLPPVPAKQAIDETGCGDAFRAGMLHQFSRGARIDEALLFASAVGSLNVETLGAARRKITEHEIHDRIAAFPEIKTLYCELLQGAN